MRLILAFSIVAVSAVGAHAAEDRYGPPRAGAAAPAGQQLASALPAGASPYAGQMLNWGGKAPGQSPVQSTAAAAPAPPQPIAPWAGPAATPQRVSYPSISAPMQQAPAPQAPTPRAYSPQTPAPQQQAAGAAPLPTNLYDRPAAPGPQAYPSQQAYAPPVQPQPIRQPAPAPAQQLASAPPAQQQPAPPQPTQPYRAPQTAAATLPPPPSAPARLTGPEEARPRAYSVLREFGGTPDPINIPPPTSYWATRPETAPPPEEADTSDFATAGGVGAEEVAAADGPSAEEAAAKRREREEKAARAAAAGKDSGK